jgi:MoaA/NifB/PqqE/SkfB family radical SAM enzyme
MLNYKNSFRLRHVHARSVLRDPSPRKFLNAVRTEWAYRRRRAASGSKPYILFIEPLYYCNLRCPLCPRQQDAYRGEAAKLDLGVIERVFDELGPYLYQCHIFGNGEPTLDWDRTQAIIDRARRDRVFTVVSTNATLVTPKLARRIVTGGLDYLIVAIDGISQESYERYRVGGRLDDALHGLRNVLLAKQAARSPLIVEWQFLVHRGNEHELEAAKAMAGELGVRIRFAPLGGMGTDAAEQDRWATRDPHWHGLVESDETPVHDFHCYWLWRSAYINADGTLGRCPKYSAAYPLGDLREHRVMELLNGERSRRHRRVFRPEPLPPEGVPEPCGSCTLYRRCHPPVSSRPVEAAQASPPFALPILDG